jgi:hypothetical protein
MEQITGRDVRNLAVAVDGGGNEFIAYTEGPDYKARVMRILPSGKREVIHEVPGFKHSTIDIAVVGKNLRIYIAARLQETGEFPLYRYDLPNVCVPPGSAPGAVAPPAPPPPNVTIVQGGGAGEDRDARKQAQRAADQANQALAQIQDALRRLAAIEGGQMSDSMVRAVADVLWNTPALKDRFYIWLKERDPGLTEQITAIALEAMRSAADPSAPTTPTI